METVNTSPQGRRRRFPLLRVASAVVVLVGIGLYVLPRSSAGPDRPHVILITLDTTRADHLGCYNPDSRLTPNIDRFAETATVFRTCVAPIPLTLPSHTSIMTGMIPLAHRVHQNGVTVGPKDVLLAERLRDRGYTTGAIVSHLVLSRPFGLDRGFGAYIDKIDSAEGIEGERRGEATSALAARGLQRRVAQGSPMFLFLHYYDPHDPYEAPPAFADRFGPSDAEQYAAEVAYVDHAVGQIFETLKALGIYESSLIILTADHGEMLGDHGERDHSYFIYDSAIKVPLIVKLPGQTQGRRIEDVVGLVDIAPTVCALTGAAPMDHIQGRDLSPLLHGDRAAKDASPRYLYCESLLPSTFYNAHPLLGLVGRRWKYIHSPRPELYDLVVDPLEAANLADTDPHRTRSLADQLQEVMTRFAEGGQGREQADLDPQTLELLAGLGYVGLERRVEVDWESTADDAKDLIDFHNVFHHGVRGLAQQGRIDEAIALGQELIVERPIAAECYVAVAMLQGEAGRHEEAVQTYSALIELEPAEPTFRLARGLTYRTLGRTAEAVADFQTTAELAPTNATVLLAAGVALADIGAAEEAAKAYQAVLAVDPANIKALGGLTLIYVDDLGTPEKAEPLAKRLLDARPRDPRCQETYGWVLSQMGDHEGALAYLQPASRQSPSAETHYRLGWTLEQRERASEALTHYQAAAALLADQQEDPLRTVVLGAIERLEGP